jgi:purine-cytosine permease-like protein
VGSAATAVVEVVPIAQPLFVPESSAAEPTPLDHRIGRASRLFWLWFAANSSVVSLAFGGALFSLGMSLRQAIVSVFVGVAISFLPLGLGTLAGKWSGQPVMIASRATFGLVGNVVPALIALITRLFWGAVLLWMVAAATARIVVGAKLAGPLSELQLTLIVMAVGFLLALGVAFFGYALVARVQLVLSILSAVLVVALVAVTWRAVDFAKALTVADGPVILVVTGVVLVFSFVGLVWANSSGDLARYQAAGTSGGASMLWASFGATLPAFLLIGYGAVLAASNPDTATGLASTPIDTIAGLLPGWYPLPLIAATALSLLSGVVLSIYSGGFALGATGVRVSRGWATVIVGALVFAIAIALGFGVSNVVTVFRDLATTLAVPVGAWAGLFAAEMIIRRRRFDTASLLARGGVYPDVNWVNLSMLVVSSIIGLGFTTASIRGLGWEGYLFRALGVPLTSDLAGTDVGVLFALLLGLLTPLVAGIPTIRRQERGHA